MVQPHGGLPPMWLGDFETAVFAGSKRRHHVPAPSAAACGVLGTAVECFLPVHKQKRSRPSNKPVAQAGPFSLTHLLPLNPGSKNCCCSNCSSPPDSASHSTLLTPSACCCPGNTSP
ncbi:hypothetical protein LH991_05415 [Schleiferilactobacillus harbinensis]|nr:hypothetical protein LH991_05415 [Schleiferilactobacillus harbinensis]